MVKVISHFLFETGNWAYKVRVKLHIFRGVFSRKNPTYIYATLISQLLQSFTVISWFLYVHFFFFTNLFDGHGQGPSY